VWLAIKMLGMSTFRKYLDEKLDMAQKAAERLRKNPKLEIISEPQLSILTFRVKHSDEAKANGLTRSLLEAVNRRRNIFLSPTTLGTLYVIRICVLNFRTHWDHLEKGLQDIEECLNQNDLPIQAKM
jgi:aromatic-L-amino-acid decarboxylase